MLLAAALVGRRCRRKGLWRMRHLRQPSRPDVLLTDTAVADDGIATLVQYWHSRCSVLLIGAGITDEGIAARAVPHGHCPEARVLEFGARSLP